MKNYPQLTQPHCLLLGSWHGNEASGLAIWRRAPVTFPGRRSPGWEPRLSRPQDRIWVICVGSREPFIVPSAAQPPGARPGPRGAEITSISDIHFPANTSAAPSAPPPAPDRASRRTAGKRLSVPGRRRLRDVQPLPGPLLLPRVPRVPVSTQDPLRRAAARAAAARPSEPPDGSPVLRPFARAQVSAGAAVPGAAATDAPARPRSLLGRRGGGWTVRPHTRGSLQ